MNKPALFGLDKSNRDFSRKESWGKNNFNSSFPASLCAYFYAKGFQANYITIANGCVSKQLISIEQLFNIGHKPFNEIFYAFEAEHVPYNKYIKGKFPRTDLVILDPKEGLCLRGLEVKLTAIPDEATYFRDEVRYGSELVIRPTTIVYLACSIIENMELSGFDTRQLYNISGLNMDDPQVALNLSETIRPMLKLIYENLNGYDTPVLIQPIWKTEGKKALLADNCLDLFVWSDSGLVSFIHSISQKVWHDGKITRQYRTAVWLYKMICDYFTTGSFDSSTIIDRLSYNTKNDKAFSSNGNITNAYMSCENLTKPRIKKNEIKNIILNNGQALLSPERRFDAIIYNSPELFEN